MQLTVQAKILPDVRQTRLLSDTMDEYIRLVNQIVSDYVAANRNFQCTSKSVAANLPSALKNQAIQDAKSVFRKFRKTKKQSVLKKPVAIWNNQNHKIQGTNLSFPVLVAGKCTRFYML